MPLIRITAPVITGSSGSNPSSSSKYVAALFGALNETVAHNLGSLDVIVQCFTEENRRVEPARCFSLNENEVLLQFSIPQNGRCVIVG